jgi:hypothetical protein
MSLLNDLAIELESYVDDEVTMSVIGVDPVGDLINVNDLVAFQVRIENTGHMNMTGVSIHVHAENGAVVASLPQGPFSTDKVIVSGLTVNAGGSRDTAFLYFKAPPTTKPAGTNLLSFHVQDYTGDWNHMFANHTTTPTGPSATYSAQVHPAP